MSVDKSNQDIMDDLLIYSENFSALLQEEKIILEKNDTQSLLKILQKKQQWSDSFKSLEKQFVDLINSKPNLNEEKKTMKLISLLKECKDRNLINGLAVFQKLSSLKRFMDLLVINKGQNFLYNKSANLYSEKKNHSNIII